MRHLKSGYKLKRDAGARKALLRNLITSVVLEERVKTTVPKAKAVQPLVERIITLAKKDSLHARRQAAAPAGARTHPGARPDSYAARACP